MESAKSCKDQHLPKPFIHRQTRLGGPQHFTLLTQSCRDACNTTNSFIPGREIVPRRRLKYLILFITNQKFTCFPSRLLSPDMQVAFLENKDAEPGCEEEPFLDIDSPSTVRKLTHAS